MKRVKAWAMGSPVKLVSHYPDDYMPPIGAVGTIVAPVDDEGDLDVLFLGHPCPNPPGTFWCVPKCQLEPAQLVDEGERVVPVVIEWEEK